MTVAVTAFVSLWLGIFLTPVLMLLFRAARFTSLVRVAIAIVALSMFVSIIGNLASGEVSGGLSQLGSMLLRFGLDNPYPFLLVGSFTALNGLFIYLMRAPTALGRPIMDHLAGLKLYLETAESDRMNMQAPDLTAERFEALLPYAVALGVEKPWAEAFEAALTRAHPDQAEPIRSYQPRWGSGAFSSGNFSRTVAASVASANAAFASAMPVSSGSSGFSSGGGGSGGGGGGGGGGGW